MKTTYFKIDRGIQDHWLWADKPFSRGQAWIDLLLLAAYKDHRGIVNGHIVTRKRGEVHASIVFLADRWGWSRNKVYRFLNELKKEQMVTTNGTADGTTLYIEKYAIYQDAYTADGTTNGTPTEHPRNNLGTTAEQPRNNLGTQYKKGYKEKEIKKRDKNGFIKGTQEEGRNIFREAEKRMPEAYKKNLEEIRKRRAAMKKKTEEQR